LSSLFQKHRVTKSSTVQISRQIFFYIRPWHKITGDGKGQDEKGVSGVDTLSGIANSIFAPFLELALPEYQLFHERSHFLGVDTIIEKC
jgi:hypothetical protein